jgi:hypothetical protein
VTNGGNTNDHKLQYFSNSSKGKVTDWFGKYETIHPKMTWAKVQHVFLAQFSEIKTKG